jgi:hypothetical protein
MIMVPFPQIIFFCRLKNVRDLFVSDPVGFNTLDRSATSLTRLHGM